MKAILKGVMMYSGIEIPSSNNVNTYGKLGKLSFILFSIFDTSSQLTILLTFMQFSRNFMYELEFVLNHVTSIYITLDPPVELSYDLCGFAKSGFMFYEHFNYCHLITVGSVLFNKFKLITRAKNDLKPDFSHPSPQNNEKTLGEALYFIP